MSRSASRAPRPGSRTRSRSGQGPSSVSCSDPQGPGSRASLVQASDDPRAPLAQQIEHERPADGEALARGVRTGRASTAPDVDAEFTDFVRTQSAALLRTAWLLVGDAHRAEELVQHALVRTYGSWSRARADDPLAYARRVLVNPHDLPERSVPAEHGASDDRDQLVRALALLSPRQRRIVVLRHFVGLPEAEVAAELGVSIGTVKSTASRSLATLRRALDETATTTPDRSTR